MRAGGIAIVLAVTLLLAASCSTPPAPVPSGGPALRLGIPNEPLAILAFIALAEDLFEEHGVEVQPVVTDCGARALDGLIDGDYDIVLAPDVPIALRSLDTTDMRIVATVAVTNDDSRVIARSSAGIRTARDLAGKRVSAVRLGQTHCYLGMLLEGAGLDAGAIILTFFEPDEGARALRAGQLDALAARPPLLDTLEAELGTDAVILEAPVPPHKTLAVVTTPALLEERPGDVTRVLAALIAAEESLSEPAVLKQVAATWLDTAPAALPQLPASGRFTTKLDQSFIMRLEHRARWLIGSGCVETLEPGEPLPNMLALMAPDILGAIDSSRISILGWSEP